MPAELPSTEQIFTETSRLVLLVKKGKDEEIKSPKTLLMKSILIDFTVLKDLEWDARSPPNLRCILLLQDVCHVNLV